MIEAPEETNLGLREQVQFCLDRVLASRFFSSSPRLSQFLRHVVAHTLHDELSELKEVSIGMAVFGKTPSYDPKEEPIVRVEARRLRARLDQYYAEAGAGDPIRIHLPKGGYQAQFEEVAGQHHRDGMPVEPTKVVVDPPAATALELSAPHLTATMVATRRFGGARVLFLVALIAFFSGVGSVLLSRMGKMKSLLFKRVVPLTSYPGNELQSSISHDGRQVVFVWDGETGGNYDVYVRLLDLGSPVRLTTNPGHDLAPQWSPDDRFIAFLRVSEQGTSVVVIPALGGTERKIADLNMQFAWKSDAIQVNVGSGPAWSADGKEVIVTDQIAPNDSTYGLFAIPLDGSPSRRVTLPPALAHDLDPVIAHHHNQVAFLRETSNSSGDIFVTAADGKQLRQITFDRMRIMGITWTADDKSLVFASNRGGADELWQVSASGGVPERIATKGAEVTYPSISDDGSILAYTATTQNSNIWRLPLASTGASLAKPELLIASTGRNDSPRYSPDGQHIAFISDRTGSWELWVSDNDGRNPRQLTNFGGPMVGTPHWSPDSRKLNFDARPNGRSVIYVVAIDGGAPQLAVDDGFEDKKPNWSRDGKSIYYTSNRDGSSQLWRSGLHGEHPIRLTLDKCDDSAESIDGKTIYVQTDSYGIYRLPVSGGKAEMIQQLRHIYPSRYFDVTDKVYVVDQENAPRAIQEFDPRNGAVLTIGFIEEQLVSGTPSLSVSADRRFVLFAQQDKSSSQVITLRK
jgi:Tol biopolymer transport system component